jgi:transcriptional regulator with XRE-family HTH domain
MAVKETKSTKYVAASVRVALAPGDAVRVACDLQQMTQAELTEASGIRQATLPMIENGRAALGAERAEKIAPALKVHPGVLPTAKLGCSRQLRRRGGPGGASQPR